MIRFLSLCVLFFVSVLCCFFSQNSLMVYAKKCGDIDVLISGEKYVVFVNGDYEKFLNELSVLVDKKFVLEDRLIIEGYSSKLNNYVIVNNKKINIQLSVCSDGFLVGYPLIENSF